MNDMLEALWEALPEDLPFQASIYPARNDWPTTEMYLLDAGGRCWRVQVSRHHHGDDPVS